MLSCWTAGYVKHAGMVIKEPWKAVRSQPGEAHGFKAHHNNVEHVVR